MPPSGTSNQNPEPTLLQGGKAIAVLATVAVLAVLYFARDVLIPITLALFLSLLLAPFVHRLRRVGFGHTSSVLVVVLVLICALAAVATVIASQLAGIASSLPQYDKTIQYKLQGLEELTRGRINVFSAEAKRTMGHFLEPQPASLAGSGASEVGSGAAGNAPLMGPQPVAVQVQTPAPNPWDKIQTIALAVWTPLESTGIVLVILIFVLFEHEALRDRLIKIVGSADLRATTNALNDAGIRLSRFFVSQFMVNLGVGMLIGIGLAACGIPHALLWAVLTVVLRFVPFVGVWIAAIFATILAAAFAPGWTLPLLTMGIFGVVEIVVSQLVEPQLYGHTTGLSPLTVVVAAIFWSWLWGPVGLVVSTPITLCLLIAGRHTRALQLLDVILGDTPALTMPQRLYQRALSDDSDEIIVSARDYLRRNSFAAYCDLVLVPALQLARIDFDAGLISEEQGSNVRKAVLNLIIALGEAPMKNFSKRVKNSVLDDTNIGRVLRQERELRHGRWQGPLDVPRGSIVICMGIGSNTDELATELLVRILRFQSVDARHISNEDLQNPAPPGSSSSNVSMCYIVGTHARGCANAFEQSVERMRKRFPEACIATLFFREILPQPLPQTDPAEMDRLIADSGLVDQMANSYVEALQICMDRRLHRTSVELPAMAP